MTEWLANLLASAVTDRAVQEEYDAGRILQMLREEGLPEADVARLETLRAESLVEFLVLAVQVLDETKPERKDGEQEAREQ